MMEGSLNVDNFEKSLIFSISFTMEGSLLKVGELVVAKKL